MPGKDPREWTLGAWLLALLPSASAGIVNWLGHYVTGDKRHFSFLYFCIEVFTSGFVGVTMFMAFAAHDQPPAMCAAVAGVSGHMGTRLLLLLELALENKIKAYFANRKDAHDGENHNDHP
ncbi:MAG: phage holin family protein [Betaproteobacteria bacterium]|nr:phage holin family protein [Betaproteobacteria bacterium]